MKKRTDFVTNSSSASFILEVTVESEEGKSAGFYVPVSPETCMCMDGDMTAEDVRLIPKNSPEGPMLGDKLLSSAETAKELADMIFEAALVEDWVSDEDDEYDDDDEYDEEYEDDDETVNYEPTFTSVSEVAPKTAEAFAEACEERGISAKNLKRMVILNCKSGNGDSAMYVEEDDFEEGFEEFVKEKGLPTSSLKERTEAVVQFLKSEPVVTVSDNECVLPDEMQVCWNGGDESLREAAENYCKHGGYWMATYVNAYEYTGESGKFEHSEKLYLEKF